MTVTAQPGTDRVRGAIDAIAHAEELGIAAVWLTSGGTGPDPIALFAAAAMRTERILLGTSIIPTWLRHPLALVQSTVVLDALAPGRFRLGVGPSHRPTVEAMYRFDWERPQEHLGEYVSIPRTLIREGKVDFDGARLQAHATLLGPMAVPVMISALRERGFRLGGAQSDGVITWNCPAAYWQKVALPNVAAGAKKAGRAAPPLIAHTLVIVHDNASEEREAAWAALGNYQRLPYYMQMLEDAGFPDVREMVGDDVIDALVVHGPEERVAARLSAMLEVGAGELLCQPLAVGSNAGASLERTLRLLGQVAQG